MPMRGIGPVPWPPLPEPSEQPARRPLPIGTPWQGATDMPPFKWPGYNDPHPPRRPPPWARHRTGAWPGNEPRYAAPVPLVPRPVATIRRRGSRRDRAV